MCAWGERRERGPEGRVWEGAPRPCGGTRHGGHGDTPPSPVELQGRRHRWGPLSKARAPRRASLVLVDGGGGGGGVAVADGAVHRSGGGSNPGCGWPGLPTGGQPVAAALPSRRGVCVLSLAARAGGLGGGGGVGCVTTDSGGWSPRWGWGWGPTLAKPPPRSVAGVGGCARGGWQGSLRNAKGHHCQSELSPCHHSTHPRPAAGKRVKGGQGPGVEEAWADDESRRIGSDGDSACFQVSNTLKYIPFCESTVQPFSERLDTHILGEKGRIFIEHPTRAHGWQVV